MIISSLPHSVPLYFRRSITVLQRQKKLRPFLFFSYTALLAIIMAFSWSIGSREGNKEISWGYPDLSVQLPSNKSHNNLHKSLSFLLIIQKTGVIYFLPPQMLFQMSVLLPQPLVTIYWTLFFFFFFLLVFFFKNPAYGIHSISRPIGKNP